MHIFDVQILNSSRIILNDHLHDVSRQENVPVENGGIFDGVGSGVGGCDILGVGGWVGGCDIQMMPRHVANLTLVTLKHGLTSG